MIFRKVGRDKQSITFLMIC